jgi:hypothetical protein
MRYTLNYYNLTEHLGESLYYFSPEGIRNNLFRLLFN